jgi:two-component system response regulator HydG
MQAKILVVDDEESIRYTFSIFLSEEGYAVTCAVGYDDAVSLMQETEFDLMYVDIVLEGKTGIDLLKTMRKIRPGVPVIMITGAPSIETAADSLRQGALDYIIKPIRHHALARSADMALKHKAVTDEREKCRLNFEAIFRSVKDGIVTVDQSMAVVEINEAATRICNIARDAAIGKPFRMLAEHCQGRCIRALDEIFESRQTLEIRYVECHIDPDRRQVVSLTASPLLGAADEFTGAVLVIRDETRLVELERSLKDTQEAGPIVGESAAIHKVRSLIEDLADVQTTVLVTGESGTGKELVVEELHRNGERREKVLVKVNCAALSENLLESELFGHVAGAFTGAVKDKVGRFQRADGGTLFLDEIGEISPRMQLRLLRFLETMEFERVGDSTPIKVDVRVVTATNQDLQSKVAGGEFREDLYYRLKVVEIRLPPLRERMDDIPILVEHFVALFNRKFDKKIKDISTDVWAMFNCHRWPGNVRELENTLEHAFIRCHQGAIAVSHLPGEFRKLQGNTAGSLPLTADQEAETVRRALRKARWNKSRAAGLLGISRRTIYRKMQKYGIALS